VTIAQQAAFYWAGVAYGILSPRDAIAWADGLIASGSDVPKGIYELSLSPPDQPKKVTAALRSLHDEEDVSEATVRGLLDYLGRSIRTDKLSPGLAIQRSYEVTRGLSVECPLWTEAMILEENYSLAVDRIVGDVAEMDREVIEWLARYDGNAAYFMERAF
jgi:hypothetical protein